MNYHKKTLDKRETGRRINSLIAGSGMTYEEIASLLELSSPRVIYEWIKGNKLPTIENLANLALILSVEMESIVALR